MPKTIPNFKARCTRRPSKMLKRKVFHAHGILAKLANLPTNNAWADALQAITTIPMQSVVPYHRYVHKAPGQI